jgi:hypothetical protein
MKIRPRPLELVLGIPRQRALATHSLEDRQNEDAAGNVSAA